MGKLYVVRHADAGHRSDFDGPDHRRPLSERGRRQAQALVEHLAEAVPARLIASPFARCIETLEPLAVRLGLSVEPDDRLAEGSGATGALELADDLVDVTGVLCSHGDVIPDLLDALLRDGIKLRDGLRWQKASVWILSRDGGRLSKGRYLPPPT